MPDEVILNGIVEDETEHYYHVCFFGAKGSAGDSYDNYVFIPKPVCRIVGPRTVAIQEWYVKKQKLMRFMRGQDRQKIQVDMDRLRLQQAVRAMRRAREG